MTRKESRERRRRRRRRAGARRRVWTTNMSRMTSDGKKDVEDISFLTVLGGISGLCLHLSWTPTSLIRLAMWYQTYFSGDLELSMQYNTLCTSRLLDEKYFFRNMPYESEAN
jgi:hypothetical protein